MLLGKARRRIISMSANIVLLRDRNDSTYQKYLAILLACQKADVDLPDEVDNYFGGEYDPDFPLEIEFEPREWHNEYYEGYEIDISELPKGVKTIRFYNSG